MKLLSLLIVVVITSFLSSTSEASPLHNLTTRVTPSQKTIYPYEPLGVVVKLENEIDLPQTVPMSPDPLPFGISIRYEDQGEWIGYIKAGTEPLPPLPLEPRTFQPRQSEKSFTNVNVDYEGRHMFVKPGVYWIKSAFADVQAVSQAIEVIHPAQIDQEAIVYVGKHELYRFFSEELVEDYYFLKDPTTIKDPSNELRQLIRLYPLARYAQWAKLGLLFVKEAPLVVQFRMGQHGRDTMALRAVQQQMKELSNQLSPFLKGVALFEVGKMAILLNDRNTAETNFQLAVETQSSMTLEDQISLFRDYIKKFPWMVAQQPKTNPKTILNQTIQELEARHYDVRGFAQKHTKEYREYSQQETELFRDLGKKKITEEEYYRRVAALIKFYVTKYAIPLETGERR